MTSSGRAPKVLVTPTNDVGKLLASLHGIKIEGTAKILSSLRIAQLALKHRVHKNHKPRIILFVGSPIEDSQDDMVKLGAMLQKNEVAVDVVNFGQIEENTEKLEAFVAAVNNSENSHLVTVPPGPHVLSDLLISSPIVTGSSGGDGGPGGAPQHEFGVDPALDPELAMAMQLSMEEARRAEEEQAKQAAAASATETGDAPAAANPTLEIDAEDAELQAALQFSMGMDLDQPAPAPASEDAEMAPAPEPAAEPAPAPAAPAPAPAADMGADYDPYSDPTFVSDVLSELEGVDPNDPAIKEMMEGLSPPPKDDKDKK
jgi:26S proteasome regulatory subunit N10